MSDPTIQTFCCHPANNTLMVVRVIHEFNTDGYNVVCLASSLLGMIGAIYQILPREQVQITHRWLSFSTTRGRGIIVWLAVADLLATLGIFVRSVLWMKYKNIMPFQDDHTSVLFCILTSAWIQYFYIATWIWTLCYAIDMRLILADKQERHKVYHFIAWTIPAILTAIGLSLLYIPDANCHTMSDITTVSLRILPNYILTYVSIIVVMVTNPILYKSSTKDMERLVTSSLGQFTRRERDIMDAIKVKFALINIVFYICWLPNLINGLVLFFSLSIDLPANLIIIIWFIMSFTNPLQALLNSMVYRRWTKGTEKIILPHPFKRVIQKTNPSLNTSSIVSSGSLTSQTSSIHSAREEHVRLLRSGPRTSINRYT